MAYRCDCVPNAAGDDVAFGPATKRWDCRAVVAAACEEGDNLPMIIGIILGVLACLILCCCLIFCLFCDNE